MCVVLVDGGGAKAVHKFVSLKIAAISVLAVILHPAWPCPFYTLAELVERPRRFRNFQCFYPPAFRLNSDRNQLLTIHSIFLLERISCMTSKVLQGCWPFQREVNGTPSLNKYF